ncbi:MAG: glutamate--tRNA ligase [Actinomycetota bacterium]|nr:glutamate--tRNA ligase [Actinomycetota bacterium]
MTDAVRCRFAPAPSGSLHVGSAHTALFNWMFARHHGGVFVLRVEDTDPERVVPGGIESVQAALSWLGLDWDEGPGVEGPFGPYIETQRFHLHREVANRFLAEGHAYRCYCTPEELEERRRQQQARGEAPGYDGRCRRLTEAERAAFEAEGRPAAVRFAIPEGRDVEFSDLVRGEVRFSNADLRDFIILRSDGTPTYLLASGVDDHLMEMTHVVRGEDLFPSTPRQILMVEALGAEPPTYAHLPLILGPDRAKLSKRHGAVAVEEFRDRGYLPEAMVNYLALLGWSPGGDEEVLPLEELIRRFDVTTVSHHPSIFDVEKFTWLNGVYVRRLPPDELARRLVGHLGVQDPQAAQVVEEAVPLIQERMSTLAEAGELLRFLFEDVEPDEDACKQIASVDPGYLRDAASRLEAVEEWTVEEIKRVLDDLAAGAGLNRTKGWQPVRAAVTGRRISPPLPESMALLGRERTVERLRRAEER